MALNVLPTPTGVIGVGNYITGVDELGQLTDVMRQSADGYGGGNTSAELIQ